MCNKIDNSQKYYKGCISRISVIRQDRKRNKQYTLYGAWIHCLLSINDTYQDFVMLIPTAQCLSMKELRHRITDMGFTISNNRKSLTTNLSGTPVLATLHKSMDGFIERLIPMK